MWKHEQPEEVLMLFNILDYRNFYKTKPTLKELAWNKKEPVYPCVCIYIYIYIHTHTHTHTYTHTQTHTHTHTDSTF